MCASSRTRCSAKCRTFSRKRKPQRSSSTCSRWATEEGRMLEETTSPKDWASLLRISKSHIQTYLICPRKFYFQYVVAIPWEFVPASLPFGSALHAAVAFFYRMLKQGEQPDLAFVLFEFKRTWEEETENRTIG